VFDPRANALNAIRLALALLVIVWHSFPLSGSQVKFAPLKQLLGETAVDSFFAISGFLILGSWLRNPQWGRYLAARVLRIFPAFWACLVITAFVLAPLGTMITTGLNYAGTLSLENATYILKNAGLRISNPSSMARRTVCHTLSLGTVHFGLSGGSSFAIWASLR
jgi:peptidoglycan/LPS O-acetylase OafA/YrhL